MKNFSSKKIAYLSIFLALFLIMGYIEHAIPMNLGIIGVKIGLSNLIFLLALEIIGIKYSILLSFIRVLIINFLFGNHISLYISIFGFAFSYVIMVLLLFKFHIDIIIVSAYGGAFHILGQYLASIIILNNTAIIKLMPLSFLFGILTGIIIGVLTKSLQLKINKKNCEGRI